MEDDSKRWTANDKTALILDIFQGRTTIAEANWAFGLHPSEAEQWVDKGKRGMENASGLPTQDVMQTMYTANIL